MTAAVLARPGAYRAEDQAIEKAREILKQAGATRVPSHALAPVAEAMEAVREAIEIHQALRGRMLGWEAYDPDLREYANPDDVAITKSAEDAEELAGYLAEVIGRYAANDVNGITEGEIGNAA
jgi:hypothetical protein